MTTNATERRIEAIREIINSYYDNEGERSVKPFNFVTLKNEVNELYKLGRTARWEAGVSQWVNVIDFAQLKFLTENEIPETLADKGENFFGLLTSHDYANRFHWALMQGSTYAGYQA